MLDSEHETSKQLDDARHVEHDTLNMYFEVYKHVFYLTEKRFSYFLFLVFFLSIEVT